MVLKRQFGERDDDIPSRESKRGPRFANSGGVLAKEFPTQEQLIYLETFLRGVVRDQVQRSINGLFNHQSSRSSLCQAESSQARAWELHFIDKIPLTLFTGNKVESEDGKPIKIIICDAVSKTIIRTGPLSSIKIEILVLDGDFGSDDKEDWSEDEFKAKLVKEREGKKPLLIGELKVVFKDGVGEVGGVVFSDNSKWTRGGKFRLGARVVHSADNRARIREARSNAFAVKDHRGESYMKHHPPTMKDEVWRLERIAKDGAFHKRLAKEGIITVGHFARLCHTNPKYLRDVLGGGISNKKWEVIFEHAIECIVDGNLYAYSTDVTIALVFDSIYKIVGVIFNGQNYQSLDKLSHLQRGLVKSLKGQAYKNVDAWIPLGDLSAFGPAMPSSSLQPDPYSSPSSCMEQVFPNMQPDPLEMQSVPNYMAQTSYTATIQNANFMETNYFVDSYPVNSSQIGNLITEITSPFCQSPWEMNNFFAGSSSGAAAIVSPDINIFSGNSTPRGRWLKIKAALTWGISVRRDVAAKKKMAKPFYPTYVGVGY